MQGKTIMDARHVALVYRGTVEENPYIGRIKGIYEELGFIVDDVHWQHKNFEVATTSIDFSFKRPSRDGIRNVLGIFAFARFMKNRLCGREYEIVHCINEDVALSAILASLTRARMFVDVRDGIVERIGSRNGIAIALAKGMRFVVAKKASLYIVPDENRKALHGKVTRDALVLENSPAMESIEAKEKSREISILFSGSLNAQRGLNTLRRALEASRGVRCVAAGWFQEEKLKADMIGTGKCDFLGAVTHRELLELCAEVDGVFAFYEPSSENNLNASPSKLYDAMMAGVPLIINDEVAIARRIESSGLGFQCGYSDHEGLARLLESLRTRPFDGERAKRLFEEGHCWEIMRDRFIKVINESA